MSQADEKDIKDLRKEADLLVLASAHLSPRVQEHLYKAAGYLRQEADKIENEAAENMLKGEKP